MQVFDMMSCRHLRIRSLAGRFATGEQWICPPEGETA